VIGCGWISATKRWPRLSITEYRPGAIRVASPSEPTLCRASDSSRMSRARCPFEVTSSHLVAPRPGKEVCVGVRGSGPSATVSSRLPPKRLPASRNSSGAGEDPIALSTAHKRHPRGAGPLRPTVVDAS
jgi:hypothetical protein